MVWRAKRSIFWVRTYFWDSLGPGLITGAADDDPSGIATYSVAGAQLGTRREGRAAEALAYDSCNPGQHRAGYRFASSSTDLFRDYGEQH